MTMDIIQVSNEIKKRIKQLEEGRKILKERAEVKAEKIAEYDKIMAITILKLKNGELVKIDDTHVSGTMPVSIIDKVARGVCWKEKLEMEKADGMYRAAVSGISSLETEMSGLQTIFKYMKEI